MLLRVPGLFLRDHVLLQQENRDQQKKGRENDRNPAHQKVELRPADDRHGNNADEPRNSEAEMADSQAFDHGFDVVPFQCGVS